MNEGEENTAAATVQDAIARLATLSALDYDVERIKAAEDWKIRLTTLDDEVKKLRKLASGAADGVDLDELRERLRITTVEPWPASIRSGAALFDEIFELLKRYIIASDVALQALVLWIVLTYLVENPGIVISPRLALLSAMPGCGKTQVLDTISELVFQPMCSSSITAASIYRLCDLFALTFLIDEADTFVTANKPSERSEDMRGILDSGHTRRHAFKVLTEADAVTGQWLPNGFSTWAMYAFAAIGRLPATLMDRSIKIWMRRKLASEKVEKVSQVDSARVEKFRALASKIKRWANDNAAKIVARTPKVPDSLGNRPADNWVHLFAIAEVAGGGWPERARSAALKLADEYISADQNLGAILLDDIRSLFEADKNKVAMSSEELVTALNAIEGQPWGDYRGKGLTKNQLARLLKPFLVFPGNVVIKDVESKGYKRSDFDDSFTRYLDAREAVPERKPKKKKFQR